MYIRLRCLSNKYHWSGIVQPHLFLAWHLSTKGKEIASYFCLWNQIFHWKRYNLWLHHLSNLTSHYSEESNRELDIFHPGWNQLLFGKVALVNKAFRILLSEKRAWSWLEYLQLIILLLLVCQLMWNWFGCLQTPYMPIVLAHQLAGLAAMESNKKANISFSTA